jgi:hypothetical protein
VEQNIKIFVLSQLLIALSYFYSWELFINVEVAFLSAFFVIIGSALSYRKMIHNKLASLEEGEEPFEKRDLLESIEDPHELYEVNDEVREGALTYDELHINDAPAEELDLKAIVKEEKAKIKTFSLSSAKYGIRGSISLLRILPYIFLILGFISLKNNNLLALEFYLPSLLLGIIVGSIISKRLS